VSIEVIPECGSNKAPKGQCDAGLWGYSERVKTNDLLPMNPEGAEADEGQGGCSPTNADIH